MTDEIVRIKGGLSVDAATVIMGALARVWPASTIVDGGRDFVSMRLAGERTSWHPLEDDLDEPDLRDVVGVVRHNGAGELLWRQTSHYGRSNPQVVQQLIDEGWSPLYHGPEQPAEPEPAGSRSRGGVTATVTVTAPEPVPPTRCRWCRAATTRVEDGEPVCVACAAFLEDGRPVLGWTIEDNAQQITVLFSDGDTRVVFQPETFGYAGAAHTHQPNGRWHAHDMGFLPHHHDVRVIDELGLLPDR